MKIALVLLVGLVSAYQTESAVVHESYTQDVHGALREMTATVTEQKLELRYLKEANEENVERLKKQEEELKELKEHLEGHVTNVEAQETQLKQLKQQLEGTQVAFSASLISEGHTVLGPFNTHSTLVFRHVVANIGNAYNPQTGIFTAPVKGVYHFEWYISAGGGHATGAALVKNGERIFIAYEHITHYHQSSSNGASLPLEAGDQVFVSQWVHTAIFDNTNHHTTFSGHLLFTL